MTSLFYHHGQFVHLQLGQLVNKLASLFIPSSASWYRLLHTSTDDHNSNALSVRASHLLNSTTTTTTPSLMLVLYLSPQHSLSHRHLRLSWPAYPCHLLNTPASWYHLRQLVQLRSAGLYYHDDQPIQPHLGQLILATLSTHWPACTPPRWPDRLPFWPTTFSTVQPQLQRRR